jgi:hypothetical protein
MNKRSLILIIFTGIAMISCEKKDETCMDVHEGTFIYTQKSLECVPYWEKSIAVYRDSLNNLIELTIQQHQDDLLEWSMPRLCPISNKDTIYYNFRSTTKHVTLGNDSINFYLDVNIMTSLDWQYFKKFDLIFINHNLTDSSGLQNFEMGVDPRDVPEQRIELVNNRTIAFEPKIEVFGEEYDSAYHVKFMDFNSPNKLYYSYRSGVVSFKDNTGKRWVLVKFY